jgi:ABC-type Fe3+-siderophore transport system permease subunit
MLDLIPDIAWPELLIGLWVGATLGLVVASLLRANDGPSDDAG